MSVNSIFGLPGILEVLLEPRFVQNEFLAHTIKARFKIEFKETTRTEVSQDNAGVHTVTQKQENNEAIQVKEESNDSKLVAPQSSYFDTFSNSAASVFQAASNSDGQ